MPIYEYECGACAHQFELIQSVNDPKPDTCPECGKGPVDKLMSKTSFQLKGSGWYVTDYKDSKPNGSKKSAKQSETTESAETKTTEKALEKPKSPSNSAAA